MKLATTIAVVVALSVAITADSLSINHLKQKVLHADPPVNTANPSTNQWIAAAAGACRGPCPALNILANHGLLPRDGRGITQALLQRALIDVYGLSNGLGSVSFGEFFVEKAFAKFADPKTGTFSLCDILINIHNSQQASGQAGVEHWASLSRIDRPNGDTSHAQDASQSTPNAAHLQTLFGSAQPASPANGNVAMIDMNSIVRTRNALWAASYAQTQGAKGDAQDNAQHIIAQIEACLLVGVLKGNHNDGKFEIPLAQAQTMVLNEQFPPGWQKTQTPFGWPQLVSCLTSQGVTWATNEASVLAGLSAHWWAAHF